MKPGAPGAVAWEDSAVPFPANLGVTWWDCLVSPDLFFDRVDWEGSFARPLLYYLLLAVLGGLLSLFWFLWGPWGATSEPGLAAEREALGFFLGPFLMLVALVVGAAIMHLFSVLLAPAHRGIRATATVICYAAGVGLLTSALPPVFAYGGLIPGVPGGYLVLYASLAFAVQIWHLFILVMGVRRAHSTSTARAAAIVLLPVAIAISLAVSLLLVAVALISISGIPA